MSNSIPRIKYNLNLTSYCYYYYYYYYYYRKHVLADPTSFEEPLLDTSLSVVVGEQGDLISVSQLGSTLISQSEGGISRDILPECITSAKRRREILSKQIFK